MSIKEQIQKRGFTISQIASLMTNKNGDKGISQSSLSQIINGNPSLDKLKEIASILNISVSELLIEEDSENDNKNTITCPVCHSRFKLE